MEMMTEGFIHYLNNFNISGNFGETERTEARVETRDPGSEGRTRGLQEGTQVKQADNR